MRKFLIFILAAGLSGGITQILPPEVTLERHPLLILPNDGGDDPKSIESKVTAIVASKATALNRFEVIDRTHLEQILNEQAMQMSGIIDDQQIVNLGKVAAAPEALLVKVLNFGQKGVPPEDEEEEDRKDRKEARKSGLFGIIAKTVVDAVVDEALEDVERYPNNIQTVLQAEVRKVDVESGRSTSSFLINIEHTGGNKNASLAKTLSKASWRISHELRNMYLLTSEVLDVTRNEVMLLLGEDMGVRIGTLFEISSPETRRTVHGREITIPGRPVGIVQVTDLSQDANRGLILRKWEPIQPGYRAVESTRIIFTGGLNLFYGNATQNFLLEFRGYFNPLGRMGGKFQFGLGTIQDSRQDNDFLLSFGGGVHYRFIKTFPFSLTGTLTLPVDLVMRSDDKSHTVVLPMFSPRLGFQTEIMLTAHRDLVLQLEYVLASSSGKWKYTETNEDDEPVTREAVWDTPSGPQVKPEGLYFSAGFRFFSF